MPWTPGASGNPKGRPPKSRALTEILLKAGNRKLDVNGKPVERKKLLAEMLWEGATTGRVTLPTLDEKTGKPRVMEMMGDDWFDVVKFLYAHIDGAPKQSLIDMPEDTTVAIQFVRTEGRPASVPGGEPTEPPEA